MKKLLILALTLISTSLQAQTYTQMQWGINKSVNPYPFGANINGTWYNLGTVSSTGQWQLSAATFAFLQYNWLTGAAFTGAVSYSLNAKLGQYISVADFGAVGNGVTDDAPAFRAAYNACVTAKFRRVWIPTPSVGYIFKSLDATNLGAIVIGDGTNSVSCSFEGEAENTAQWGFNGGVNLKMGPNLNRPMVYVRERAGSATFKNLRMDFAGYDQTGCLAVPGYAQNGCPQGSRLWGIVIEDGVATPEGSIHLDHVNGQSGYNGNLYLGNGRGALECQYCYFIYGGQNTTDYSVFFNGYDVVIQGGGVGSHAGYGLFINQGSQYQISNAAFWMNNVGEYIRNSDYTQHTNINYQFNKTYGLVVDGSAYTPPTNGIRSHAFANTTFESNNATVAGTASDIQIISDTSTQFSNAAFNGAFLPVTGTTYVKPVNNIYFSGAGSQVRIGTVRYTDGTSNTSGFTNSVSQVLTNQPGIFQSRNQVRVLSATQYDGFSINNGANTVAAIQGTSATNDNGWMYVAAGGVVKALINSNGNSYFNGGNLGVGLTAPTRKLEVIGDTALRDASGTAVPTSSALTVNDARQYNGLLVSNGTNVIASLTGFSATNDNGLFKLLNGSVAGIQFTASGNNNFIGTKLAIGSTTPASTYALEVTGDTNTTGVYRVGGTAGLTTTKTVRDSAGTGTCTLEFTGGLLTGGTC